MANKINERVYKYIAADINMKAAFSSISYLVNENKTKQPYAVIYLIDDPLDRIFNCPGYQGQARFQCDTFNGNNNWRFLYMEGWRC